MTLALTLNYVSELRAATVATRVFATDGVPVLATRVALILALVAGCSSGSPDASGGPSLSVETSVLPAASPVFDHLNNLRAGECYDPIVTRSGVHIGAQVLSCDEPHTGELYARFDLPFGPDAAYPDESALDEVTSDRCEKAFRVYVGRAYGLSKFDIVWYTPVEPAWVGGDRTGLCSVVGIAGERLTGTAKGSGL